MESGQQYGSNGHRDVHHQQPYSSLQPGQPNAAGEQRPTTIYSFTAEELRVLRECNRESLLFRCIPFATVFSSVAYIAMHKGYLSRSPRFGVFPKVTGFAFLGYMLGKFSYQSVCAEKILKLPDSRLANAIRKGKGMPLYSDSSAAESDSSNDGMADVFTSIPRNPIFDDHKPDERDRIEGLDEYDRVTDSLSEYTIPEAPPGTPVSTYDDRRQANRDEYSSKFAEKHRRTTVTEVLPPTAPLDQFPRDASYSSTGEPLDYSYNTEPPSISRSSPPRAGKKNKYGDIVYDA